MELAIAADANTKKKVKIKQGPTNEKINFKTKAIHRMNFCEKIQRLLEKVAYRYKSIEKHHQPICMSINYENGLSSLFINP